MKQFLIASLLVLIGTSSYGQYQTKKGRWMITHTLLSGGPHWYGEKDYEDGVLESSIKGRDFLVYSSFSGPDWGGIDFEYEKRPTPKPAYRKSTGLYFSVEPQVGYFIKDNLMVGAAFIAGFDISKTKEDPYVNKSNAWYIGAGPIARYYLGNQKKYRPFVGFESRAYIETGKGKRKDIANNKLEEQETVEKGFGLRVKPYAGYAMFLGKHWTADVHVGFEYVKDDYKTTFKQYTDKVLDPGYPYTNRSVDVEKMLSLNVGIAYTF
ncbi:MAG TPA: hypothetical protein VHM26_08760 [Chitinophagaceae bacterium]|jgi:hypothetical protein|nr:hypothetical protein [Chitinophagaceae bacterium]